MPHPEAYWGKFVPCSHACTSEEVRWLRVSGSMFVVVIMLTYHYSIFTAPCEFEIRLFFSPQKSCRSSNRSTNTRTLFTLFPSRGYHLLYLSFPRHLRCSTVAQSLQSRTKTFNFRYSLKIQAVDEYPIIPALRRMRAEVNIPRRNRTAFQRKGVD